MINNSNNTMSDDKRRSLTTYNHITYLLYVLSYFTAGLLWIVPIFMNYAKRRDADGTWLATHFDWQIAFADKKRDIASMMEAILRIW